MSLEMGQHHHGIVIDQMASDGHLVEPFATLYRKVQDVLFIQDVHRAESPTVDFQSLAMKFGRIAVSIVVGVGLDDGGFGKVLLE